MASATRHRQAPTEGSRPRANTRGRSKRNKRRRLQRKRLREVEEMAQRMAVVTADGTDPTEAVQMVLDRAVAIHQYAAVKAEGLTQEQFWRETMMGRIPHEWVRFEADMRREVLNVAGRMLQLDIAGRQANAAEVLASTLAPVLEGIFSELKLTPEQREQAPALLRRELEALEAGPGTREVTDE